MAKVKPKDQHFDLRVKSSVKEGQRLRVVEIRYVPTPDAHARLARAIDILLKSAARNMAAQQESQNSNAKEKKPSAQARCEDILSGRND